MIVEIKINYDLCIGCKECVRACSYGVLECLENKPIVADASNCAACLECEKCCPVKAVKVEQK